jgi:hypothetical protein
VFASLCILRVIPCRDGYVEVVTRHGMKHGMSLLHGEDMIFPDEPPPGIMWERDRGHRFALVHKPVGLPVPSHRYK